MDIEDMENRLQDLECEFQSRMGNLEDQIGQANDTIAALERRLDDLEFGK